MQRAGDEDALGRGARGFERGGEGRGNGVVECWSKRGEHLHGIVRREGAFAAGARKNHAPGDGRQRTPDADDVLVAQDSENDRGALVAELLPPCFSQDLRATRVMCAVDNRALIPDLKARRPMDAR